MSTHKSVRLTVKRQNAPSAESYWESFDIPWKPHANIISCLQDIQCRPVTAEGKEVNPVAWDCNCLEEVCGSCTMVINGKVRQACTALIDQLELPIYLE
jgi:succinate dehydrogenase / fumarate reductase, iron-sulfur subunit